jgi:hypothetical protein
MGRFCGTLSDFDTHVAGSQHRKPIFIGHIITNEQRGVNIKRLPQRPETMPLGAIRHSALKDPVTRAHHEVIGPLFTQQPGGRFGRFGHVSIEPPRMNGKPERLHFNPRAWNVLRDLVETL